MLISHFPALLAQWSATTTKIVLLNQGLVRLLNKLTHAHNPYISQQSCASSRQVNRSFREGIGFVVGSCHDKLEKRAIGFVTDVSMLQRLTIDIFVA
jgi:hypothetical protein